MHISFALCAQHPFGKLPSQDSNKQISMLIGSDDKRCNQLQYIRTVPIFKSALSLNLHKSSDTVSFQ